VEHVDELIAGQALYALSPEDEERVALHVAECDSCRRQLREAEALAASLAYAVPAAAPPPDLRDRVLAAVEPVVEAAPAPSAPAPARPQPARRSRSWWPRISAVAVPILAAAVVGLVIWNVSLHSDLSGLHSQLYHGQAGNLRGVGNVIVKRNGNATLFASIAPAPPGKTYEAWVIRGKVALPAGIFQGGGTVNLQLTRNARPGDVIAVTVEPAGGTKAPTSAPIAAHTV
jgi:anti-sigma-K factor RskA